MFFFEDCCCLKKVKPTSRPESGLWEEKDAILKLRKEEKSEPIYKHWVYPVQQFGMMHCMLIYREMHSSCLRETLLCCKTMIQNILPTQQRTSSVGKKEESLAKLITKP